MYIGNKSKKKIEHVEISFEGDSSNSNFIKFRCLILD